MTAHKTLVVSSRLPVKISTVVIELNEILNSEEFHAELCSCTGMLAQSNIDGPTLSTEFKRIFPRRTVTVQPYVYPFWNIYKNVVTAFVKIPTVINLNTRFLEKNDDIDYAKTIGHETTHVIDLLSPYKFGHGDNDSNGDELTAPHIVGDICARLYKQRRDKKLSMAARKGDEAFAFALTQIGANDQLALARMALSTLQSVQYKGVHDYGTESGSLKESTSHIAD